MNAALPTHMHAIVDTPVGPMHLYVDTTPADDQPDGALAAILFDSEPGRSDMRALYDSDTPVVDISDHVLFERCAQQLNEYFAGTRTSFDLPLRAHGTDFQRKAWAGLLQIPYGTTLSYSQQATKIDRPQAVRAIGSANGRNPLAIVVPCHRVIGTNGSLTGFGGGLATKEWLLRHEGALPAHQPKNKGMTTLF